MRNQSLMCIVVTLALAGAAGCSAQHQQVTTNAAPTTNGLGPPRATTRVSQGISWRSDSLPDDTKTLSPELARIIMIARAYVENMNPRTAGLAPYTFEVYPEAGYRWTVVVTAKNIVGCQIEIGGDGSVIWAYSH
jgi:hypothetical protein